LHATNPALLITALLEMPAPPLTTPTTPSVLEVAAVCTPVALLL
jgi:hypothetical protein